ncbi:baseplate J/gp47 family protein [Moritella viscosa]
MHWHGFDGTVIVSITAIHAGYAGNLDKDSVLTLVSSVPGVQARGASLGMMGGIDIEPINQLLERLLYRKRNPPQGGAEHDYVAWSREVGGVSRAWCTGAYRGGSTVGIAFVFDERDDILPTPDDITHMLSYIYRHQDPATKVYVGRPAGIEVFIIPLVLKTTSMTNRKQVLGNLTSLERSLSPGETLFKNTVGTAIGSVTSVQNYLCNLDDDVLAKDNQIHAFGDIQWG